MFSGNSSYNYAFGTCTLNDYLRIIENKKEKYYDDRKYSVEQVVKNIENLINYFTDENNKTRNMIIDEINHKLNNMKKLIGEENEILRENAENNDKVVDNVNWENMLLKKENKQIKDKLSKIETLIINHNCDTGDIYYKYNSKFLKSELKQRILEILEDKEV